MRREEAVSVQDEGVNCREPFIPQGERADQSTAGVSVSAMPTISLDESYLLTESRDGGRAAMSDEECAEVISHVRSMLKFKRQAQRLGLRELCDQCGVSIPTLSRFERGHSLDAETFLKLIEWLHPTVQDPPRKRKVKP